MSRHLTRKTSGPRIAQTMAMHRISLAILILVMLCLNMAPAQQQTHSEQTRPPETVDELRQAAARGDKSALQQLTLRGESGDVGAQNQLGIMYATGQGVPADPTLAMQWFLRGANQGDAASQNNLAGMYASGKGVPKNPAQAFYWFRRAAEQGYASAQRNLGAMYRDGNGVQRDYVAAYVWLDLAAKQGIEGAGSARDRLEMHMTMEQIADAKKLSREWKPVRRT